jgi:hypothetical protein
MADRIIAVRGIATGANITVTIDDNIVYNGPGSGTDLGSTSRIATMTIDADITQDTSHTMTVISNSGSITVGMVQTNYLLGPNPLLTQEELVYYNSGTTADAPEAMQLDVQAKGGWSISSADAIDDTLTDLRSNFTIDGQICNPADYATTGFPNPFTGWTFNLEPGQILGFDFVLPAQGSPGI